MFNAQQIAQRYIQFWNETDTAQRQQLAATLWMEDAHYVDPLMQGHGSAHITAMIGAVHQQFPQHVFTLHGTPEGHHDRIRFSWTLAAPGQPPVAMGTDVGIVSADGRLHGVTGFLDTVNT